MSNIKKEEKKKTPQQGDWEKELEKKIYTMSMGQLKNFISKLLIKEYRKGYNTCLKDFKLPNKRQVLRNCVYPELGLHIFNCAFGNKKQGELLTS